MKITFTLFCIIFVCHVYAWQHSVSDYDVVWETPSVTQSMGSMPLGNGDVALNVWVDGTLSTTPLCYLASKSDAWDINSQLYKVTQVCIAFDPPLISASCRSHFNLSTPFSSASAAAPPPAAAPAAATVPCSFEQRLDLANGLISVTSSTGYAIHVIVDESFPVVSVSARLMNDTKSFSYTATTTTLRPIPDTEQSGERFCTTRSRNADVVFDISDMPNIIRDGILTYHRNNESVSFFDDVLRMQGLESLHGVVADPLANVTFGSILFDSNTQSTRINDTTIGSSVQNQKAMVLTNIFYTAQTDTVEQWLDGVVDLYKAYPSRDVTTIQTRWKATATSWNQFWARSYVIVTPSAMANNSLSEAAFNVTRHYAYQRFMDACDGRQSATALKFNGQQFTATINSEGPDFRNWGGSFWWQNTRQPYYNALAAGDLDLLRQLYAFYLDMVPLAQARSRIYFGHDGAFFPETTSKFGTYSNGQFGWDSCKPASNGTYMPNVNRWIRYHFTGALELVLLMLDDFSYTGNMRVAEKYLVPIASSVTQFFRQHWTQIDPNTNQTIFFPSQSLETWQCPDVPINATNCVTNPTPDIAGLHAILSRLVTLPSDLISSVQRRMWQQQLNQLPSVTIRQEPNKPSVIWPGEKLPPYSSNTENTELYTVHPFRLYQLGQPNLQLAQDTYTVRRFPCNVGWCQDVIFAAMLNLTSEAASQVAQRAAVAPASGFRFPGFAQHYQDFEPSLDHFNFMRTAMHYMLLQPLESGIVQLFPTWPTQTWDVSFKLFAPQNTVIEAACVDNKLVSLIVTPPERKLDIRLLGCNGK
jgi:Domain of unknown function (DUF5703)